MHVIQLRQPWSVFYDQGTKRLEYRRKFHAPTGADNSSVELAILFESKLTPTSIVVSLNETRLEPRKMRGGECVYAVEQLLMGFNSLVIEIAHELVNASNLPEFGKQVIQSVALRIVESSKS